LGLIIIQPNFGQARAKLPCETSIVASGPGSDRVPDSSAPQPPGARADRATVSCVPLRLFPFLKAGSSPAFCFSKGRMAEEVGAQTQTKLVEGPTFQSESERCRRSDFEMAARCQAAEIRPQFSGV